MNVGGANQSGSTDNITNKFSDLADSGFIKHITRFDSETKSELSNVIQYLVIVIVPFYLLNKGIGNIMPEFDEKKGNIELLGEVIIHSVTLLLGIYIIHRIVTYLPTFSGDNLAEINYMNIVFLIVFIGLNSDNGKKVNIVYDRLLGETTESSNNPKKQTNTGTIVTAVSASLDISNPSVLLLNEGSLYFKQNDYQSSRMSFEELQMNIETSPPIKVLDKITEKTSIQSKFQWSISLGLMSLIAVLLAIPVSKVPPREGRYKRVLPAIFIFIFYLGLLITSRGWLETGIIQAFPGMYSVHLIFMVLGLFLLNRADSFKN